MYRVSFTPYGKTYETRDEFAVLRYVMDHLTESRPPHKPDEYRLIIETIPDPDVCEKCTFPIQLCTCMKAVYSYQEEEDPQTH